MRPQSLLTASAIAAVLTGCSGAPPPGASSAGYAPVDSASQAGARSNGSWMAPEAKSIDLLYVSDLNTGDVDVYSYPAAKPEGKLKGFSAPHGECVDAAGDVFITSGNAGEILEYAHGGTKPINTLSDPGYFPKACSVDPKTGDLAVMNLPQTALSGDVAIYKHASGKPKSYTSSNLFFYYFDGYDSNGNLFVDGTAMDGRTFGLAVLVAGGKKFTPVSVNHEFVFPGGVQWVGQTLVVGDQVSLTGPSTIYKFSVKGNTASETGSIPLTNSCDVLQFWIVQNRMVAANTCLPTVMYFKYPAGGKATRVIGHTLSEPIGVTVSMK